MRWSSLLMLVACSSTTPELLVDVISDLEPVAGLTTIEATLLEGPRVVAGSDYVVLPAADLRAGVRVAELEVASGTYTLRVRGLGPVGELVGESTQIIALDRRLGVSVRFDAACVGVTCPGPGDPRTFTACAFGGCVAPACVDDPALCVGDGGITERDGNIDAPFDAAADAGVDAPPDPECEESFGMACASLSTCCSTQVCASRESFGTPPICTETCVIGSDIEISSLAERPYSRGGCPDELTCVWSGSGLDGFCGEALGAPEHETPNVGDACTSSTECWSPFGWGSCLQLGSPEGRAPVGVCTVFDCDAPVPDDDEGQGLCGAASCLVGGLGMGAFCATTCSTPNDCDPGIACIRAGMAGEGFCLPYCTADTECRGACVDGGMGLGVCEM